MVVQKILDLLVLVRIQVGQQRAPKLCFGARWVMQIQVDQPVIPPDDGNNPGQATALPLVAFAAGFFYAGL